MSGATDQCFPNAGLMISRDHAVIIERKYTLFEIRRLYRALQTNNFKITNKTNLIDNNKHEIEKLQV